MVQLLLAVDQSAPFEEDITSFGGRVLAHYPFLSTLLSNHQHLCLAQFPEEQASVVYLLPSVHQVEVPAVFVPALPPPELPFGTEAITLGPPASEFESALPLVNQINGVQQAQNRADGQGVIIVVADSGVDQLAIPAGQQATSWTDDPATDPWLDTDGHGSMIARIALAVAPQAQFASLKMRGLPNGGISMASFLSGLEVLLPQWILNDKQVVINSSWGLLGCQHDQTCCLTISSKLLREMNRQDLAMTVFAAGNFNLDCLGAPSIHCINSNRGAVSVGAMDARGVPQDYSSRGPGHCSPISPVVSAPTFGVFPWGGTEWRDFGPRGAGTSSAAPQVAGAVALIKSQYPQATNNHIRTALALSAHRGALQPPLLPLYDPGSGFGRLRADRALDVMALGPMLSLHPLSLAFRALSNTDPTPK